MPLLVSFQLCDRCKAKGASPLSHDKRSWIALTLVSLFCASETCPCLHAAKQDVDITHTSSAASQHVHQQRLRHCKNWQSHTHLTDPCSQHCSPCSLKKSCISSGKAARGLSHHACSLCRIAGKWLASQPTAAACWPLRA